MSLSENLAVDATMTLLAPLLPRHTVINANEPRRHTPGYDILIDEHVRLQVKGGTFVESVGWTHSTKSNAPDLGYDVMVFVDAGVLLDARVGRLARYDIPRKQYVDFYVIPNSVVRGWVDEARHVNGKGVQIYAYKRPLTPGTQEHDGQTRDIFRWRDRYDVILELLR